MLFYVVVVRGGLALGSGVTGTFQLGRGANIKYGFWGAPLKHSNTSSCTPAIAEMSNFIEVDGYICLYGGGPNKFLGPS